MGKTVLVTGASGFIGSHLAEALLGDGHEVRTIVRRPETLERHGFAKHPNFRAFQGDLLEPRSITEACRGVQQVYHLAGIISTRTGDRKKLFDINVKGSVNLMNALKETRPEKIVYLASIFALAKGERHRPATEESFYNLEDVHVDYFESKRAAQLEMEKFEMDGMPVVYVYPGFCYGPGDIYVSSSVFILSFLRGELPVLFDGGQNILDVRDCARGLIQGMEKGVVGRKYLIGDHNLTFKELAAALAAVTGKKAPSVALPRPLVMGLGFVAEKLAPRFPLNRQSAEAACHYWFYDTSRARRELGYSGRPLEETLRDAVTWFRENGYDQSGFRPPVH